MYAYLTSLIWKGNEGVSSANVGALTVIGSMANVLASLQNKNYMHTVIASVHIMCTVLCIIM